MENYKIVDSFLKEAQEGNMDQLLFMKFIQMEVLVEKNIYTMGKICFF